MHFSPAVYKQIYTTLTSLYICNWITSSENCHTPRTCDIIGQGSRYAFSRDVCRWFLVVRKSRTPSKAPPPGSEILCGQFFYSFLASHLVCGKKKKLSIMFAFSWHGSFSGKINLTLDYLRSSMPPPPDRQTGNVLCLYGEILQIFLGKSNRGKILPKSEVR